jgi:hypothetical protein
VLFKFDLYRYARSVLARVRNLEMNQDRIAAGVDRANRDLSKVATRVRLTAGAYHLLTILHICKPRLSCFEASVLPLTRPRCSAAGCI